MAGGIEVITWIRDAHVLVDEDLAERVGLDGAEDGLHWGHGPSLPSRGGPSGPTRRARLAASWLDAEAGVDLVDE
jgi:hypothetical protein